MTDLPLPETGDLLDMRPGLRAVLTDASDWRSAVRLINMNQVLRAECERIRPLLDQALAIDEPSALEAVIAEHAEQYGLPLTTSFTAYSDALAADERGFSPWAIRDAFRRWKACETYPSSPLRHAVFPSTAEFVALAVKARAVAAGMRFRATEALKVAPVRVKTDEDRAAVRAMRGLPL